MKEKKVNPERERPSRTQDPRSLWPHRLPVKPMCCLSGGYQVNALAFNEVQFLSSGLTELDVIDRYAFGLDVLASITDHLLGRVHSDNLFEGRELNRGLSGPTTQVNSSVEARSVSVWRRLSRFKYRVRFVIPEDQVEQMTGISRSVESV
jgi:hypothetical protein